MEERRFLVSLIRDLINNKEERLLRIYLPEHGLLFNILWRALGDLGRNCWVRKTDYYDAKYWIFSNSQKPWSFNWLASQISDKPDILIKKVRNLADKFEGYTKHNKPVKFRWRIQ